MLAVYCLNKGIHKGITVTRYCIKKCFHIIPVINDYYLQTAPNFCPSAVNFCQSAVNFHQSADSFFCLLIRSKFRGERTYLPAVRATSAPFITPYTWGGGGLGRGLGSYRSGHTQQVPNRWLLSAPLPFLPASPSSGVKGLATRLAEQ
jgi:hypothetical protein